MANNVIEGIGANNLAVPVRMTGGDTAIAVADVAVKPGEDATLDRMKVYTAGSYVHLTASGNVKASAGALIGFFVSDASTNGTLRVMDGTSTVIGTITDPNNGWHDAPFVCSSNISAVLSGSISVSFSRV